MPIYCSLLDVQDLDDPPPSDTPTCGTDRKDNQKKVLMQLQLIFAHLIDGKVQFHVPQGFWRDFR